MFDQENRIGFQKHKYNAQRTTIGEETFPSKLEADVYAYLKFKEKHGLIKELKRYASVELTLAEIKTRPDFTYLDQAGQLVYAEAKGMETERWRMIKKLWKKYGPGKLEIYKGNKRGVYLFETIIPS